MPCIGSQIWCMFHRLEFWMQLKTLRCISKIRIHSPNGIPYIFCGFESEITKTDVLLHRYDEPRKNNWVQQAMRNILGWSQVVERIHKLAQFIMGIINNFDKLYPLQIIFSIHFVRYNPMSTLGQSKKRTYEAKSFLGRGFTRSEGRLCGISWHCGLRREGWTGGIRRKSRGCSCKKDTWTEVARVCTLKATQGSKGLRRNAKKWKAAARV